MILALSTLDTDLYAVLIAVGFIGAIVAVFQAKGRSVLPWACAVVFFALAWNALAAT